MNKKTINKAPELANQAKQKLEHVSNNSPAQKTKRVAEKTTQIVDSHMAILRMAITLSNQEAELIEQIKQKLNKTEVYPSKSEIIRAGLWSLKNKNDQELEEAVKDLVKVRQTRMF